MPPRAATVGRAATRGFFARAKGRRGKAPRFFIRNKSLDDYARGARNYTEIQREDWQ